MLYMLELIFGILRTVFIYYLIFTPLKRLYDDFRDRGENQRFEDFIVSITIFEFLTLVVIIMVMIFGFIGIGSGYIQRADSFILGYILYLNILSIVLEYLTQKVRSARYGVVLFTVLTVTFKGILDGYNISPSYLFMLLSIIAIHVILQKNLKEREGIKKG